MNFIVTEELARILISNNVTPQLTAQSIQNILNISTDFIRGINQIKENKIGKLFQIMRSVDLLDLNRNIMNINAYLMMKLSENNTSSEFRIYDNTFSLDIANSHKTGAKTFKYVLPEKTCFDTFEKSLVQALCMFPFNIPINPTMLKFTEFMINIVNLPHAHAILVNDLNADYECISRFVASALSAEYQVYNSPQQITGLIHDSIVLNQQIIVYVRKPEETILNILSFGLKSGQKNYLNQTISDDSFMIENGAGNTFPLAMFSRKVEEDKTKVQSTIDVFSFFAFHMFKNMHFIFSVSNIEEIPKDHYHKYFVWDKNDEIPKTDKTKLEFLFKTISQFSSKAYVPVIAQFNKITFIYKYFEQKLNEYIKQRHMFLHEVMTVVESIEVALLDCDQRAENMRIQIKIDESMKVSATQAVNNAMEVVKTFTGDLAKAESEYETIYENNQNLINYKERDASSTIEEFKKAQKRAQKSFTSDEQYKLYVQQHPSQNISDLFSAYCILIGLTPRINNDYWPEARGILKSGRLPNAIQLFDPNDIPPEHIEKYDVAMKLVNEKKFQQGSPCYYFAVFLKTIHVHTKRTTFNSCVLPKMSEMMMIKSNKEEEIVGIKERLSKAQTDADQLQNALSELNNKIINECKLLENTILFSSIAKKISKIFPSIKQDLLAFSNGEKSSGKNSEGFLMMCVFTSVVKPLFDPEIGREVEEDIKDMMVANLFEYEYFINMKEIIGTIDPLLISLLAGDRIITVFDPYHIASALTGCDENTQPHQTISHFNFVYADNTKEDETASKIISAAESGNILVVKHADNLVDCGFFCAAANKTVVNSFYKCAPVSIDPDFKAILIVDQPPKWMPPHMSFIAEIVLDQTHIESTLAGDKVLLTLAEKEKNAELSVIQQRENLYLSLQGLHSQLKELHSTKAGLLKDTELQAMLNVNAKSSLDDIRFTRLHALDRNIWIKDVAANMTRFCGKLQSFCKYSSMYLWPLEKIEHILHNFIQLKKRDDDVDFFEFVYSYVSSSMHKKHRNMFNELKKKNQIQIKNVINEKVENPVQMFVVHVQDLGSSANFFSSLNVSNEAQLIISKKTKVEDLIEKLDKIIDSMKEENIVLSFFECDKIEMFKIANYIVNKIKQVENTIKEKKKKEIEEKKKKEIEEIEEKKRKEEEEEEKKKIEEEEKNQKEE